MVDTYRVKRAEYAPNNPDSYYDIPVAGNSTATELFLVGKVRAEYGQEYDENVLHLLENFASPESALTETLSAFHAVPALIERPVDGQWWFNKTRQRLYWYNKGRWIPSNYSGDVASNWGVINHGCNIPVPVGFTVEDCSWIVSPAHFPTENRGFVCTTTVNGQDIEVDCRYWTSATDTVEATAFYQIIGTKGNSESPTYNTGDFRVVADTSILRENVLPMNVIVSGAETEEVVVQPQNVTGEQLSCKWLMVSPVAADPSNPSLADFGGGYTIRAKNNGVGSDDFLLPADLTIDTKFELTVNSSAVFPTSTQTTRGATFVLRVQHLVGGTPTATAYSLPVRVEFYS